jgi:hypothetical protein
MCVFTPMSHTYLHISMSFEYGEDFFLKLSFAASLLQADVIHSTQGNMRWENLEIESQMVA